MATAPSFARLGGAFLLTAILTALVIALNALVPGIALGGEQQLLLRLAIVATLLTGAWIGLGRASFAGPSRLTLWLVVAGSLLVWQTAAWALARNGAFVPARGVPLLPVAIALPLLIGLPVLLRSRTIGSVLDALPPSWLIGLQVYRVFGSIFLVAWSLGALPTEFAWAAGVGDVLVGLLALPVAYLVAFGATYARPLAVAWNVLGIVDLVDAVSLGALTTPGPLQLIASDHASSLGTYPLVLIPSFAVPLSVLLHALSLRQLRRASSSRMLASSDDGISGAGRRRRIQAGQ